MRRVLFLLLVLTVPLAAAVTGLRGDGSGVFPVTGLPTTWDVEKGENLAWKVELPAWGTSEPVAADGRVLVCADPESLLCFDAVTGAECWRAEVAAVDGLDAAAVARRREILGKVVALGGADLRKDPRLKELKADLDWLRKSAVFDAVALSLHGNRGTSTAPPVSDGQRVWVRFATGSMGCYDLATGKILWLRKPALASAPVLLGAPMALVAGRLCAVERGEGKETKQVASFDPATGDPGWRSPPMPIGDHAGGGGLLPLNVGGKELLATSTGEVLDPATGRFLIDGLGVVTHKKHAHTVPEAICYGLFRVRLGWKDGLLQALDPAPKERGDHLALHRGDQAYQSLGSSLKVFAAADLTSPVATVPFGLSAETTKASGPDLPPTLADGRLYCPLAAGHVAVVEVGDAPKLLALNRVPGEICAALGAGSGRLFVRTTTHLFALGKR